MNVSKNRSTRRKKSYKKALSVPEIKQSFDVVNRATYDILKEGGSTQEQIKKFQKLWKSVFHRPVGSSAAENYLKLKKIAFEKRPPRNNTRKNKQKGGSAPLDYALRPGVGGIYGNFPEYQTAGLKAYDSFNQHAITQDCGVKDITPNIYGSGKQSGGNLKDYVHGALLSPSVPSVPSSIMEDGDDALAGGPMSRSPAPYE